VVRLDFDAPDHRGTGYGLHGISALFLTIDGRLAVSVRTEDSGDVC
jgi:hypothetical protein